MTRYRSALDPEIVTAFAQDLPAEPERAAMEAAGLFEAMNIAADLASMELLEDRIAGLTTPAIDRRYIRLAVNMDGSWETHRSSIFDKEEIWTVCCGANPNSIFWSSLREDMSEDITQVIESLIVPAAQRALKAGVKPIAMLLFAEVEDPSNHQRLALRGAEKAAREVISRQAGSALS